jgi:hypothetical protein
VKKKGKKEEKEEERKLTNFHPTVYARVFLANFSGCPSKQIFIYLFVLLFICC